MKSTMDACLVYVWTREQIEAHFLVCYVALLEMCLVQVDVEAVTGTRSSSEVLRNMVGCRLDANVYHFDYRTDLTDALCGAVEVDLSREAMTKFQMNKVISVAKRSRS